MNISCFKCDKELENFEDNDIIHPIEGLHFKSYGHYGTAVFDPMDGSSIDIVICDSCLSNNVDKIYGSGKKHF